ncbi:MAG: imelysin family protein [Gammaproteobacteria bacterium]|nr:imelysin family protein [Gammaproteobacteria bacterium]
MRIASACLSLVLVLGLTACGGGSSSGGDNNEPPANSGIDQRALLTNYASIMRQGFAALGGSVDALETSVITYCDSLGSAGEPAARTAAQDAFKSAMNDVQYSLLHSVGPSLEDDRMVQLYSWPLTSSCQIDLKLARNLTELNLAVNIRGLDALEYLLFVDPAANHSCPASLIPSPPDLLDNFDALSADQKQARRCDFMRNVVDDAAASAQILADAWDPAIDDYGTTLINAVNPAEALNEVTDAMFYFEELVKENKLDQPLGGLLTNITPSCGAWQPCPQDVESPHARISKENLRVNMIAFQELYHGGAPDDTDALGLDDWLIEEGETALATNFGDNIQAVIDGLDNLNGTLYDAISNDLDALNALLTGPVQDVSIPLRESILQVLGLSLPQGSASDTD